MLRVEVLQRVRLGLEAVVELSEVLNEVLDGLRPLLFFGKWHLHYIPQHSVTILNIGRLRMVHDVSLHRLQDVIYRLQGTV